MRSIMRTTVMAAALAFSLGTPAQTPASTATAAKAVAPSEFTNADVRKVDKEGKKIVLKHEEIKNLGMPSMAMVFQVGDPSMLDRFKAGDKVRFKAIYQAGQYVLVDLQPAR